MFNIVDSSPRSSEEITLVIDATNRWIIVGLFGDGLELAAAVEAPRESFRRLLPMIQDLLRQSGRSRPDWILTAVGPGSFTGIRISLSAARDLAQLWNIPALGVPSPKLYLAELQERYGAHAPLAVLLDGKQQRVYAAFADAPLSIESDPVILDVPPADFLKQAPPDTRFFADVPTSIAQYFPAEASSREAARLELLPPASAGAFYRFAQRTHARRHAGSFAKLLPQYMRSDYAHAKYPDGLVRPTPRDIK
jgi:tRNA threonylcarbamoyl adenosine modification protein YeaZ